MIGSWSTACGDTSGATILTISITSISTANHVWALLWGVPPTVEAPSAVFLMHAPKVLDLSSSVDLCATGLGSTLGLHPILQGPREGL